MRGYIVAVCVLMSCVHADDSQYVKSVKGGHGGGRPYNPGGANLISIFSQGNQQQHNQTMRVNLTAPLDLEVGVCYIEVPTVRLVDDPSHVPAGNGSRPDLSRIRTCCKGYTRNIHNFRRCDPVCTIECVNALCTAPEVCTCFPDHARNLAGFCIPTCPIGCQNGHCAGGECLCNEGFKLDSESRFCIPSCEKNCGGLGNCTSPNTCDCKPGYEGTPDGSCRPKCDQCLNGDCVAPNECQCHQGFVKDHTGKCSPLCTQGCGSNADCIAPNQCRCHEGYDTDVMGKCKPHCSKTCGLNGDCVAPEECQCRQGYAKDAQELCSPQCSPACDPDARCVAPNICERLTPPTTTTIAPVQPGRYQPVPYQPIPYQPNQYPNPQVADQLGCPCINGVCVDSSTCACNPGYVMDKTDPTGTRCLPNCPGGCPNGVCSAPNFCICNQGYYKDRSVKGRPTCVKRARRSIPDTDENAINVAELLTFYIPDSEY